MYKYKYVKHQNYFVCLINRYSFGNRIYRHRWINILKIHKWAMLLKQWTRSDAESINDQIFIQVRVILQLTNRKKINKKISENFHSSSLIGNARDLIKSRSLVQEERWKIQPFWIFQIRKKGMCYFVSWWLDLNI